MQSAERWRSVTRFAAWSSPAWARPWWRSRAKAIPLLLLIAGAAAIHRGREIDLVAPNSETAIAEALTASGLECDASDVAWVDGARGLRGALDASGLAIARARAAGEPADLYLVEARLSPEGVVLGLGDVYDLTETNGVDESRPLVRSHVVAYATSADGLFTGVHVVDLDGRSSDAYADFTRTQRVEIALTNLQQTGRTRGVVHDTYALDPVAGAVSLAWRDDGTLDVLADGHAISVVPREVRVAEGSDRVRIVPDERARPGNVVTWAVDRVRAMPWFGDDRMQWVKAIAFTALDVYNAHFARAMTAKDAQDELGLGSTGPVTFTDPEVGWPPSPMTVPVSPPFPGEGQWIPLDNDRFITPTAAGTAPAFVTSFVRPDVHRQDVRVYVTLWDPRQIALHMEAGTVEPIAADGERGPGLIPRAPEVMKHVVAAFNGGFQAEHGEYGMEANGIEYLPPKPYAATVVELRDGSNGFGAWPDSSIVPPDVTAFRQNLTALVEGDQFNPWHRNWWGGTPPGWPDQIHSARSAICLTKEGFVGYFYSTSIGPEDLAAGMLDARCAFGIHLDMNPGHAGFEFYDVAQQGQLAPLGRPMQPDWEAEGKVSGMPGWVFRSRRMIRAMGHMLFPRYIQREARDFFYLTARSILPGAPLPGTDADEGKWRTKALPQHGFPYALATTWVHAPSRAGLKLRVVRADPRTMKPADAPADADPTVLDLEGPAHGDLALWWSASLFSVAGSPPAKDATRLVSGYPAASPPGATARAAVGVQDEDGMLVWVELPESERADATTAAAMDSLLQSLGCTQRMSVPGDSRALPGGTLDAAGEPLRVAPSPAASHLVRVRAPDAHPVFESTPIVPVSTWQPLQAKRVRYFYKPPPAASSATAVQSPR